MLQDAPIDRELIILYQFTVQMYCTVYMFVYSRVQLKQCAIHTRLYRCTVQYLLYLTLSNYILYSYSMASI